MKAIFNLKKLAAAGILCVSLLAGSLQGSAQYRKAVIADPRLGSIMFTDMAGYQLDEAYVQPGEIIRMKIPVLNSAHGQVIPAGSCKIKIGLGTRLQLDPAYDLNNTALGNYFQWTAGMNSGQVQITGELVAPLPASISHVEVAFRVKGTVLGNSTITANFLVTNHQTDAVVSDEDGTNNASFLKYTVTDRPAPFSITAVNELVKEGCAVKVLFGTEQEINLVRFEIEISRDGVQYEKVKNVSADGSLAYQESFEIPAAFRTDRLYVRIRNVERNGRERLSDAKIINGLCASAPVKLGIYPNPAHGVDHVVISAGQGIFEGKYRLTVMDMAGKTVLVKEVTVNGVNNFQLKFGNIAAGKYLVKVSGDSKEVLGLLKFEKL